MSLQTRPVSASDPEPPSSSKAALAEAPILTIDTQNETSPFGRDKLLTKASPLAALPVRAGNGAAGIAGLRHGQSEVCFNEQTTRQQWHTVWVHDSRCGPT